jgi:hypothetical protein
VLGHHEPNEADRRDLQVLAAPLHGGHHEGIFSAMIHKMRENEKKNRFILLLFFFSIFVVLLIYFYFS